MAMSLTIRDGQLSLRCCKPSVATVALRFAGKARKLKHAFFSPSQWCCSASMRMVAALPTSMYSHSFSSQISFSRSMLYLSAATSRCWQVTSSSSLRISGKEPVYAKRSSALNTSASISSTRTLLPAALPSFMGPKSSAANTGEQAASTHR
ncbi:hypothetical protein CFC21_085098, partial [Triticum aestivum]|uniref:Uncharacterized protein n=2 Tax=Triticum aestivum TaxID=4565 RepID=A0A3B6NVY1_WHEAT